MVTLTEAGCEDVSCKIADPGSDPKSMILAESENKCKDPTAILAERGNKCKDPTAILAERAKKCKNPTVILI